MRKKTVFLMSVVVLLALVGTALADVAVDDFESYTDTADLRATWAYMVWDDGTFDRYLDTTGGAGTSQAIRFDGSAGSGGFGGMYKRITSAMDLSSQTHIRVWQKTFVGGVTILNDMVWRFSIRDGSGYYYDTDRYNTIGSGNASGSTALSANGVWGGGGAGGYIDLPLAGYGDGSGADDWYWKSTTGGPATPNWNGVDRVQIMVYSYSNGGSFSTLYDDITVIGPYATNPSPPDNAPAASIQSILSWTPGDYAASHNVYFGTTSPGTFQGNQAGTTFDPGALALNTTYYWRIDGVNGPNTWTGNIWSFTTQATIEPNAKSFCFGTRNLYAGDSDSLGFKQSTVQELSQYFGAVDIGIHNWGSSIISEAQEWIDTCEDYNLGFMFHSWKYPGTYTNSDIPGGYKSVKLDVPAGTFTEQTGDNDYDVCSDAAAQYRADRFKEKIRLLTMTKTVYFMFNEDTLAGFQTDSSPYYQSPTYSDGDLQSYRNFMGDPNAKFPVLASDVPTIPGGSAYKIYQASAGDPNWDQWWDWRFKAFADYLDKMAKAAGDASAGNGNYKGTMYVGMNRSTYEVTGAKMPAIKLEYIADSNYITVLHSDTYGVYTNISQSETANAAYKSAAQAHGKAFATMEELWRYNQKDLVGIKDVAIQLERNHKYEPDMASVYPSSVFHQNLAWSGYSTSPVMAEYWGSRENLVPPSSSFKHADFDWGSPRGPNDYNSNPPWITDVSWDANGYFDTSRSSYRADNSDANYVGSLAVQVDRAVIDNNDITLTIDYTDYSNVSSYMYVQLRDSNDNIVVNDLTGNILTGTGRRLRKGLNIPLKDYPDVTRININRYYGDMEVFYSWLDRYPGWFLNSYRADYDPWIMTVDRGNSFWNMAHSSYRALSTEPNDTGSLQIQIDRTVIDDDVSLYIDHRDYAGSYMYVQLRDSNDAVVIDDLIGNILTGTGERLSTGINIPFSQYPTASSINIRRKYGDMEVFSTRLSSRKPVLILSSASNCYWDPNRYSWRADAGDPNGQGYYRTQIDGNVEKLSELTMILTYTDYNDANMYIQTADASLNPISNVTGNILTGTGQQLTRQIPIDLSNTNIKNILVRRSSGDFEIVPPVWSGYKAWYIHAENTGVFQTSNSSSSYWDYDRNSFVLTGGSYAEMRLSSSKVNEDVILTIDYTDYASSDMSIQLRGSSWNNIIVSDLTGNILTGTGARLTKNINIPLSQYPDAYRIHIRRNSGSYELFSARLSVTDPDATTMIDDFESYTDTADMRATWATFGTWETTIFDRYLDTTGGAGSSQAMRIDSSYDSGPSGFGGWFKRDLINADWSAENGIRFWQKGSVSGSLSLSDVVYRVWLHETDGDWWKTDGAIPLDDATYGGGAGGGYVFLPFAGGTSWSWQDVGGSGANDDGVMQLDNIAEFQVSVFAWSTTNGDSYSMWMDNINAPATIISGTVTYDGYVGGSALFDFELREPGMGTIIANAAEDQMLGTPGTQITVPMSGGVGSYSLTGIPADDYDVTIKKSNTLREIQAGVSVAAASSTTNVDYTIRGGDADDDNIIDYADVGILADDWVGGAAGPADFNGDGEVNFNDYAILAINWLENGAL